MTDYRALLDALARVEFILIGGLAATVHGSARLTQDVDVVYGRRPENLDRIVRALAGHAPYPRGAPAGLPFAWDRRTLDGGLNFTLRTDLGDIDLFGEIAGGGTYDNLLPHTIEIELFGQRVRCLDLPTLIRVKRAAGRPQDLEAIAELEALEEETKGSN
jgi:hypothetical protein